MSQRHHVVHRRRQPAVDYGSRTHRTHQRLRRARSRAPGDVFFHRVDGGCLRPAGAHQLENGLHDTLAHRHVANQSLGVEQRIGIHYLRRRLVNGSGSRQQDLPLRLQFGVGDVNLHKKAVELGLGQRIRALLFQRVLRRQDVKRNRQPMVVTGHGDAMLLHCLQQSRLCTRAGAVNLIGHQKLAKYRPLNESKAAPSHFRFLQNLRTENIGWHQVGCELNAALFEPEHRSERFHKTSLTQSWNANQEQMSAGQKGDQGLVDDAPLTKNYPGYRITSLNDLNTQLIYLIYKLRTAGFGGFRYGARHTIFLALRQSVASMKKYPSGTRASPVDTGAGGKSKNPAPPPKMRVVCDDLDMRVDREGVWYYQGSPIRRKELVCLFASVLTRNEAGKYWLITPSEICNVEVEDVPFLAVELFFSGSGREQVISLRSNVDEIVSVDNDHPIYVIDDPEMGEPSPYLVLREGIEARLTRAVFYELVDMGVEEQIDGEIFFGVWSRGFFFPLGKLDGHS